MFRNIIRDSWHGLTVAMIAFAFLVGISSGSWLGYHAGYDSGYGEGITFGVSVVDGATPPGQVKHSPHFATFSIDAIR